MSSGGVRGSKTNITWDGPALDRLLESAIFKDQIPNYLDKLRDLANTLAQEEGSEYRSAVHTAENMHGFVGKPGAYVYTGNFQARVDEKKNATLLKVAGQAAGIINTAPLAAGRRYAPTPSGMRTRGDRGRYVAAGT